MNIFQAIIAIALVGNTALGLVILFSNARRKLNRAFFFIVLQMALWLGAMFIASGASAEFTSWFFISLTSVFAGWLPLGAILLQTTITDPNITFFRMLRKLRWWLWAGAAMTALCFSPAFVVSSHPTEAQLIQTTVYGWGFPIYIAYLTGAIALMAYGFWKTSKSRSGVQKIEIQFLEMGCVFSLTIGIVLAATAELVHIQEIALFVPLAPLVFDAFVGYGIATRRILAVSAVLQRVVSYGLMALYLCGIYLLSTWLWTYVFGWMMADSSTLVHLLAALTLAFSVAPAHGWMQTFSQHLFGGANFLNVNVLLEQASHLFQEVSTEADLMANFTELVSKAFGSSHVTLLCPEETGSYRQAHPLPVNGESLVLFSGRAIPELLMRDHEAFSRDTLHRMRPTSLVLEALETLESTGASVAVGGFVRKDMKSILLLSAKKSGRIYDRQDQHALQLLCDQFAVALENASLYTAVQNSNIYNDILLNSLTSGIVAVNSDRVVTVFNRRAQKLLGLPESALVGTSMTALPLMLVDALDMILATQTEFRDKDMTIQIEKEKIPLRVSGSLFHGNTGELLGALLVFNDMTMLRKMAGHDQNLHTASP